jgi:hypothetical protein
MRIITQYGFVVELEHPSPISSFKRAGRIERLLPMRRFLA